MNRLINLKHKFGICGGMRWEVDVVLHTTVWSPERLKTVCVHAASSHLDGLQDVGRPDPGLQTDPIRVSPEVSSRNDATTREALSAEHPIEDGHLGGARREVKSEDLVILSVVGDEDVPMAVVTKEVVNRHACIELLTKRND